MSLLAREPVAEALVLDLQVPRRLDPPLLLELDQPARLVPVEGHAGHEVAEHALALGDRTVATRVARAHIQDGDPTEAARFLTELRADNRAPKPTQNGAIAELRALAEAQVALGQDAQAVEALELAIDRRGREDRRSAPLFFYLADIQERMGRVHQAAENRKTAARLRELR